MRPAVGSVVCIAGDAVLFCSPYSLDVQLNGISMSRTGSNAGFNFTSTGGIKLSASGSIEFVVSTSSIGGGSAGGGDYCIEMSDGSSTCFSLWIVALVAGVGIFALAMMSGGGRRR